MEVRNLIFVALALLLVFPIVQAKGLDVGEIGSLIDKPNLSSLDAKQVELTDRLDKSYIIKEGGVYFKELKQIDPIVWIDKKDGDTYHVDSQRDFIENETVTLEFYYDIQPDWIAHYAHSGKFDRYYFPTQWDWTPDCVSEDECNGGWVTFEVYNIEEGRGSSTFPIGTTGPQWATQGQGYGEFDGVGSYVEVEQPYTGRNINQTTFCSWNKFNSQESSIVYRLMGESLYPRLTYSPTSGGTIRLQARYYNTSGTQIDPPTMSTPFNHLTTGWSYICGVFNETGRYLYLDGTLKTSGLNNAFSNYSSGTNNLWLGQDNNAGFFLNGSQDEVLIYNRSLSQAEITALYNNYSVTSTGVQRTGTPSTEGLVLNINFDNSSVGDASGNANHGTNTNVSFGSVYDDTTTLVSGTDYNVSSAGLFSILNGDYSWSLIDTSWDYILLNEREGYSEVGVVTTGLASFADWIAIIVVVIAAAIILGVVLTSFGRKRSRI